MKSKYRKLSDKDWLSEKYLVEKLSIPEIGKLANIPRGSIRQALVWHKIKIREYKPKFKKPDQLKDKDWLYQKYWIEKLSLSQVAVACGAEKEMFPRVRQSLLSFGIPVRGKSEGRTVNRIGDGFVFEKDIIEGCLLGDGFLSKQNKESEGSFPFFGKKNIFRDHVDFVAKQVIPATWETRVKSGLDKGGYNKGKPDEDCEVFYFKTLTHQELLPLYLKWYPAGNNFEKVIPEDISLTPRTLMHWYLDDGFAFHRKYYYVKRIKKTHKKQQFVLTFACQSFKREELQVLCGKIYDIFKIEMTPGLHQRNGEYGGTGMEVTIRTTSAQRFYDTIGLPPFQSLSYKWIS